MTPGPASVTSALAPNYAPLPVTLVSGSGAWVRDDAGRAYLDLLAGYSALNFGHGHPALLAAAHAQLDRLTLTSRAFSHELLEPFAARLAQTVRQQMVLPMNTGAEAVETAVKAARRWGYEVKGVPADAATVVVAAGNFHGRTTTIVSFSDDDEARAGFGPFTPGFRVVPYGDATALADAIDATTVAVLLEPVQGESGVIVPPGDYWPAVRRLTADADVLLIADEIQSGLGRTGTTLAVDLWDVHPDLVTLGKALGGGLLPVSAVAGRADVLGLLQPGSHGSTFGGNPLACAVGLAVLDLVDEGTYTARAREIGPTLHDRLEELTADGLLDAHRGVGLWAGIDVPAHLGTGRELSVDLMARGILVKDTHGQTLRLAPPLCLEPDELCAALDALADALRARA